MNRYLFELGEKKIHYIVKRTSRRYSVGICVMPDKQVVLRVPKRLAKGEIDRILKKRASWILKKQSYYQNFQNRFPIHYFISGEEIPYLGRMIRLEVESNFLSSNTVLFQEEKLIIFISKESNQRSEIQKHVLNWYRLQASQEIQKSILFFTRILKVVPKKISIRNQKHLWGSCNERHHLSFNWRLILLPIQHLNYIVAHEICHMIHLNHSEQFWKLLQSIVPDSETKRKWLKEHSQEYLTFPRSSH